MRITQRAQRHAATVGTAAHLHLAHDVTVRWIARLHPEQRRILERRDANDVAAVGREKKREAACVAPVAIGFRTPSARRRKEKRHAMGCGRVSQAERVRTPSAAKRRTVAAGIKACVGDRRLDGARSPAGRKGKCEHEASDARGR